MQEMCRLINPCVCKECGNELLFFVTTRNTLIDYSEVFKGSTAPEVYEKLENKRIKSLKCIVCGKQYIIDWSDNFPKQLTDRSALTKFGV